MYEHAELDISEMYRILYKRKNTFIILFIIVFFTVAVVSFLIPATYRASAKLITQNEIGLYPADIMPRTADDKVFLNSQKEIMSSRFILTKALSAVKNRGLAGDVNYPDLKGSVSIDYLNDSNVLEARVDRKNEKEAMEFANAISSAFINYNVNVKKELVDKNLTILTRKTNALRADIENIETKLKDSNGKEQLSFYQSQVPYLVTGIAALNNKNISTESDIKRMQLELDKNNNIVNDANKKFIYPLSAHILGESSQASFVEPPWIEGLRKKISDKENEMEELLADYTEDYPEVQALHHQIASLDKTLESALKKTLITYEAYYKGYIEFLKFQKQANDLGKEIYASNLDNISKDIKKAAAKEIEYQMLSKTYDIKQGIYALFLQRQKDLELLKEEVSNSDISNIRVLEDASLPLKKVSPNLPLNLSLGAFFGVLIGISGSVIKENKDLSKKKHKIPAEPVFTGRRLISRLEMGLLVTYELIGDASRRKYKAVTKDISIAGANIETDKYLSKGIQLLLKIYINDMDFIEATGEIIWTNPSKGNKGNNENSAIENGVHFVKIDSQEREKLINYLYGEHYLAQKARG